MHLGSNVFKSSEVGFPSGNQMIQWDCNLQDLEARGQKTIQKIPDVPWLLAWDWDYIQSHAGHFFSYFNANWTLIQKCWSAWFAADTTVMLCLIWNLALKQWRSRAVYSLYYFLQLSYLRLLDIFCKIFKAVYSITQTARNNRAERPSQIFLQKHSACAWIIHNLSAW